MIPWIILEGADNLGKSTAAMMLRGLVSRGELGDHVQHLSKPGSVFDYLADYVRLLARGPAVWDRFHLGAYVYGYKLGLHSTTIMDYIQRPGVLERGETKFETICAFLRHAGAKTIVLYASDEAWYARRLLDAEKAGRSEMFHRERILAANQEYMKLLDRNFGSVHVPVVDIGWDVSRMGFPDPRLLEMLR